MPVVENLILTSFCSNDPNVNRRWRVRNPNAFDVEYTFQVIGTSQTGTNIAPPGDSFFFTHTVPGSNTTRITWLDEDDNPRSTVKASSGAECTEEPGTLKIVKVLTSGPLMTNVNRTETWRFEIRIEIDSCKIQN
ncbi:hypothetical protein [Caldisalinibacter kiritimatiensis]|uniref:Uncharacterized protein n=1 Tax=Caldisalinibacter kiritimatiensis TaxID=1304284 RepID=R1CFR9_9FIRM|nr:hypothetical protein [Caldisalinibacter kiritimatiensis]EOD01155.1 hypothetical protein L21TH_0760 [Caldisalinibacter kiritimatiensis]